MQTIPAGTEGQRTREALELELNAIPHLGNFHARGYHFKNDKDLGTPGNLAARIINLVIAR